MSKDLSKYQDAFFVRQEEKQVANYNDALVDPRTRDGLVPAFAFQFMMKTYDKHLGHDIGRMIFIGSN